MIKELIIGLTSIIIYMFCMKKSMHIFQLEEYININFIKWIFRNKKYYITYITQAIILSSIFVANVATINNNILKYCIFVLVALMQIVYIGLARKGTLKKEFKKTSRTTRIIVTSFILFLIEIITLVFLKDIMYLIITLSLLNIVSIINILVANIILIPIQKIINSYYISDAKKILEKRKDLKIVGITGSYGKTSTKFILETILSEKYNVLATPNSFNTPLGNVKTIRETLKDEHEIYIAEMGAKKVGEIKEICDIVRPQYGIITSIGKQHLDTFKNLDNIIKTKYELIECMPVNGVAFFPADNEYTYELYQKEKRKKYVYGLKNDDIDLDLAIKDVSSGENGSTFTLYNKKESIECTTKLLGEHNAINILGCAMIALELGLSFEQIKTGISKIKPVEHRLELIPNNNGTIVLDDAFNSNPNGTKVALKVLSTFSGRKIIVTPGMIELGDEEYELNKEFGRDISKVADIAILVGKNRTKPIFEGITEENFIQENIHVVKSLDEATKVLASVIKVGDVVLFENDLPDNYNE